MQNSHLIVCTRTALDRQGRCIRQKYSTLPGSSIQNELQIPGVCKLFTIQLRAQWQATMDTVH